MMHISISFLSIAYIDESTRMAYTSPEVFRKLADSKKFDASGVQCDITQLFKNIRVLPKETKSTTVQLLAEISAAAKGIKAIKDYIDQTRDNSIFVKIAPTFFSYNSYVIER